MALPHDPLCPRFLSSSEVVSKMLCQAPGERAMNAGKRNARPVLIVLLLSLAACLLSSCTTTVKMELGAPTALPVVQTSLQPPPGESNLSMTRPRDLREKKTIAKFNYGSFSLSHATIFPAGDPAPWVGNGVAAALENNGYQVAKVETVKDARTPLAVYVAVTNLTTSVQTGFFSVTGKNVVAAKVSINRSGEIVQQREYTCEASESGAQIGAHELQAALNVSLEDFLNRAIPDVCAGLANARLGSASESTANQ
jgi:hypothetical protein